MKWDRWSRHGGYSECYKGYLERNKTYLALADRLGHPEWLRKTYIGLLTVKIWVMVLLLKALGGKDDETSL